MTVAEARHIAVACGGTGGHIFPGLATAEALRARGHRVTLWLAGKDVEKTAALGWDGPAITVPAEGFPSGFSPRAARVVWRLTRSVWDCRRRMRAQPPDALLAMGSYASVGPTLAARAYRRPVTLHEANVIPGRAIVWLASRANAVAASFEETRFYLRRKRIVVTGLPLRAELVRAAGERPARPPEPFTALVMGGSRGARPLNRLVSAALAQIPAAIRPRVIHLAGPDDAAGLRAAYAADGTAAEVHAFCNDMADAYRRAHLAICRAGASTCAELMLFGLPALLVPYPYAARRHQQANARALERVHAADVVEEANLEPGWLAEYLTGCRRTPERLDRLRAAAEGLARPDAAARLADLVEAQCGAGAGT